MEKNKRRPVALLCRLALATAFVIAAAGHIREIRDGREAIARCRETLNRLQPLPTDRLSRLEERLTELRAIEALEGKPEPAVQMNPEDSVGSIRAALQTHAIGVERLRTLSTGGVAATEFVLSGAPVNFLKFLQGAAELPLPLSYISIKPNAHSSTINITVRFSHEQ